MIQYAPNFLGLTEIRTLVAKITGDEGRGHSLLPQELLVLGRNFGDAIVLRVGGNSAILAGFLQSKLGVGVIPGDVEPDIPYIHWITFTKGMRDAHKDMCAKAIIMAYLACNDFIEWQVQPHPPQPTPASGFTDFLQHGGFTNI